MKDGLAPLSVNEKGEEVDENGKVMFTMITRGRRKSIRSKNETGVFCCRPRWRWKTILYLLVGRKRNKRKRT